MNVDLELYRVFYVVAKNKHMTRASEELHISQPAISQSIKKLEGVLGGTLFLRSNKGMEHTPEGSMLFKYVNEALEIIKNAENEFTTYKDLEYGEIKIGSSTVLSKIILMNTMKKFHKDYPNINLKIVNDLTNNLITDLEKGKLDIVIFNEGDSDLSNINVSEISKLRYGFVYNNEYFNDDINSFDDLNKYPLILQNTNSNSRKFIDQVCRQNNVVLKAKTEVVSQELVIEFTYSGFGYGAVLIPLALRNHSSLKELKINKKIPSTKVYLGVNKNINLPFAGKKFLEYLNKFETK